MNEVLATRDLGADAQIPLLLILISLEGSTRRMGQEDLLIAWREGVESSPPPPPPRNTYANKPEK